MPLSSNPCQADQIGERPFTGDPSDPLDVAAWRHDERQRLRAERTEMTPAMMANVTARITEALAQVLAPLDIARLVIGASWPITGEPDLLPFLATLRPRGAVLALSACVKPPEAMRFRRWTPGAVMERGLWNLPVPPASAGEVVPNLLIAPVLGWAGDGHRIGFGTGYFDRTLAAMDPRPFAIGVGLHAARLSTIHPLPHDRALDLILTECGIEAGSPPLPSRFGMV